LSRIHRSHTPNIGRLDPNVALRVRVRVVFETSNVEVKGFGRKSGLTYEDEEPNKVVASCKLEFVTRVVTWSFTVF
jgi:hypothetical protein